MPCTHPHLPMTSAAHKGALSMSLCHAMPCLKSALGVGDSRAVRCGAPGEPATSDTARLPFMGSARLGVGYQCVSLGAGVEAQGVAGADQGEPRATDTTHRDLAHACAERHALLLDVLG